MKVLFLGNVDRNIGDDLMLLSVIESVKTCKNIEVFLNAPKDLACDFVREGVEIVTLDYTRLKDALRIIRTFDTIAFVGGSLFQLPNFRITLHYVKILFMLRIYRFFGKKLYLIGCNVGPVSSYFGWFILGMIFRTFHWITVRDTYTYIKMGKFKKKDLYLAADLVFSYWEKFKKYRKYDVAYPRTLGISVYNFRSSNRQKFFEKMATIIDLFLERTNGKVILFAFSTGTEEDQNACTLLKEMCNRRERVEICEYEGNILGFVNKLTECDTFICIRFHSLILSLLLNIPCLPIAYSVKCENFLKDIGFDKFYTLSDFLKADAKEFVNRLLNMDVLLCNISIEKYVKMSKLHLDRMVVSLCRDNVAR